MHYIYSTCVHPIFHIQLIITIYIKKYLSVVLIEEMAQLILIQYFKYIPMSHQNFRRRFSFTFVIRNESEKNWCKDSGTNSILFAFKNNILHIVHDAVSIRRRKKPFHWIMIFYGLLFMCRKNNVLGCMSYSMEDF